MRTEAEKAKRIAAGLTVLRVAVGVAFVAHGAQKLFVFGLGGVSGAFGHMGIPLAGVTAPLVVVVELLAGLGLVFGLLTRLSALGLAIDMLGAIVFVHGKNGFFLPNGFEYAFALLASTVALVLAGPGALALDNLVERRREQQRTAASDRARGDVSVAA